LWFSRRYGDLVDECLHQVQFPFRALHQSLSGGQFCDYFGHGQHDAERL